jgi:sulfur carrier protein ThiS
MQLYVIADSLKKLEDMAEDDKSLVEYLDSVELQLKDKVNNVIKFQMSCEATAEAIDTEIKRLTDLKYSYLKKADNIKNYISFSLLKNGIEKLETDISKLSFRKSQSLVITDEKLIPEEFIKIKEVKSIDKIAIKEAIKGGRTIDGAIIEEKQNLQIK